MLKSRDKNGYSPHEAILIMYGKDNEDEAQVDDY
jgi:hypothetical protein